MSIISDFKQSLKREELAIPFSILVMYLVGHWKPEWWIEIFAIAVGWVVADVLLNGFFIAGGEGAVWIPMINHLFQSEGYTYLAFLSGIIFSTYASAQFIKPITSWLSGTGHPVFWGTIVVACLVYGDLRARYYAHNKTRRS
jgi:hypothetical protein